eukprot:gene11714-11510_t
MASPDPHAPPSTPAAAGDTHATTEAEHGGGGLPQFEFQHWAGQIAWLLILFVILYVLMSRVFTPRLRKVLDERTNTIASALAQAHKVQEEANAQAAQAQADLADARAKSHKLATDARAKATAEAQARQAVEDAKLADKMAEAETRIRASRDAAMAHVSTIASDTASAIVEKLTGAAPKAADLSAALAAMTEFFGSPENWVGWGLIVFLGIVIFVGGFKKIAGALDEKAATIQADLDEAARLRAEAEALLAEIRGQKEDAEKQAAGMLAAAEADAARMAIDAQAKLEETIARRAALAERKIASAEAQASAEVKAAAADLATQTAERLLTARIAAAKSDPSVDAAIAQLASRLQ